MLEFYGRPDHRDRQPQGNVRNSTAQPAEHRPYHTHYNYTFLYAVFLQIYFQLNMFKYINVFIRYNIDTEIVFVFLQKLYDSIMHLDEEVHVYV